MSYWNYEYTKVCSYTKVMVGGVVDQDQTFVLHATNVTHLPSSSFSLTHFYLPTLLQFLANLIDVSTQ